MNKPLYEVVNGYAYGKLTAEGEIVWNLFVDTLRWAVGVTFFDDADDGELADLFADEFPRLCKRDIYNAVVTMRSLKEG